MSYSLSIVEDPQNTFRVGKKETHDHFGTKHHYLHSIESANWLFSWKDETGYIHLRRCFIIYICKEESEEFYYEIKL